MDFTVTTEQVCAQRGNFPWFSNLKYDKTVIKTASVKKSSHQYISNVVHNIFLDEKQDKVLCIAFHMIWADIRELAVGRILDPRINFIL